ncbi:MAG TPA: ABC transporter substrate-binding protein [Solirubrobacteraceae bacterium]|nr:ABC transporter substrate-binding protein [Solirubrobacteraceae bacterium]
MRRPGFGLRPALAGVIVALLLSACGGSTSPRPAAAPASHAVQPVSLMLDFTPNAIHVGIYDALGRHLDARNGIRLHVEVPGQSTDAISELEAGRVDFAILDIHDLALAREKHAPIVGILPIVQEPLAAVIAQPSIHSPRQLAGRTVGVTGAPSDLAVLDSIVAGSGGSPTAVRKIDIGYSAVADLLSGRVAAATAFWNDEGVTITRRRPGYHVFRVTQYGAPSYPELVVCATRSSLRAHPARARALVRTLTEGYDAAIAHPAAAARVLEHQVSGLDPSLVSAELPGELRAFTGPEHRFGVFDMALLRRWARWEARFGIVSRPPDVRAAFDPAFTPR